MKKKLHIKKRVDILVCDLKKKKNMIQAEIIPSVE